MPHKIAFIIATKDRPRELRQMLLSLQQQSVMPDQIVIVDSGASVENVAAEFPSLNICYAHHSPPSAAQQRNAGLALVNGDATLIGFLDDDVVLEPNAIVNMLAFWESAPKNFGGAAFNWLNPPTRALAALKRMSLVSWLGIYPAEPGMVAKSGWHSVVGRVERDTLVEWLPSGASVWRRNVFQRGAFDDYFQGYSYLEDLDFSYGISRRHQLCIVADAGFRHYPASAGREGNFRFGKIEVANRLHVVRKHGLSIWRCYVGLIVRFFMTTTIAIFKLNRSACARAAGNIVGLLYSIEPRRMFKHVGYLRPLIGMARMFHMSGLMRKIYYLFARPKDGVLPMSLAGIVSRFRIHTPEELRILESMGGGEHDVMREVLANVPSGAVVYDVGANVGLYTIFLAKSVGHSGRVIAFEPHTQNHKHLVENIVLNGLSNVMTVKKALGSATSTGRLGRGDIIGNYSLLHSSIVFDRGEDVEIVAGDEFAFAHQLPIPYLVKIDVEGFELAVVMGLRQTLCNSNCRLVCIELHPYLLPAEVTADQVIDVLKQVGFQTISKHKRKRDFHLIMSKSEQLCIAA
jgi:FkbM family methyltransferase